MKWRLQIFVFGSNLDGRHGKGAALVAREQHGAIQGQAEGFAGRSYAIPTKGHRPRPGQPLPILPLPEIEVAVQRFLDYAHAKPHWRFNLTQIGCGLAGYTPAIIAPLFEDAIQFDNVYFPAAFVKVLGWPADDSRTSFDDADQPMNQPPDLGEAQ